MLALSSLRAVWMVLNNLIGEMEKQGVQLAPLTYAELRNSKMVLEYLSSFGEEIHASDGGETQLKLEIEQKILSLKDSLLIRADERVGSDFREAWESKVNEALEIQHKEQEHGPKTLISDLPRNRDTAFFRIKLPDNIPVEVVSDIAENCQVNISLDGERHLQVSGKRECVRDAMKKLGELFYGGNRFV